MPGNRKKETRKMTGCVLFLEDTAPAYTSQVFMTAVTESDLKFFPIPHVLPYCSP